MPLNTVIFKPTSWSLTILSHFSQTKLKWGKEMRFKDFENSLHCIVGSFSSELFKQRFQKRLGHHQNHIGDFWGEGKWDLTEDLVQCRNRFETSPNGDSIFRTFEVTWIQILVAVIFWHHIFMGCSRTPSEPAGLANEGTFSERVTEQGFLRAAGGARMSHLVRHTFRIVQAPFQTHWRALDFQDVLRAVSTFPEQIWEDRIQFFKLFS